MNNKIFKMRILMASISGDYRFKHVDFYCKAQDKCEAMNAALDHAEHQHCCSVVKVKDLTRLQKSEAISELNALAVKADALEEKAGELENIKEELTYELEKAKAIPADPRIKLIKGYEEDKGGFTWEAKSDEEGHLYMPFTEWDACIRLEGEGIQDICQSLMKECNPELFPIKELGLHTMMIPLSDIYCIETKVWIVPVLDIRKEI